MHPNGQIPAYEWAFGDVNPPVHAWAAIRVYQIEQKMHGRRDRKFLERVFQKLLLNFTWWVNRKDAEGNNIFEGGFLGLDNISAFDRTSGLPAGGQLEQADGTSWMAMYCLNLLEHRARARQGGRRLRGHRHQVLRAFRVHRRGGQQHGRTAERPLGRQGRLLLRCAETPRWTLFPHRCAVDRGIDPPVRHWRRRPARRRGVHGFRRAVALVHHVPAGPADGHRGHDAHGNRGPRPSRPGRFRPSCGASSKRCWTRAGC